MRKLKNKIYKLCNILTLKSSKRVYLLPHNNGKTDKYDVTNYSSDNILSLINYLIENKIYLKSTFYLECYSVERMDIVKKYVEKANFKIVPIINDQVKSSVFNKIRNHFLRYSCKIWISCTPFAGYEDKIRSQRFICLSYCSPLKSGISLYHYDLGYLDNYLETSFLTASIHAAEFRNLVYNSPVLGFPRNDNLFKRNNRVLKWLSCLNISYKKIIVYAPTYRDYKDAFANRNVLGFNEDPSALEQFLSDNGILLITKFHPLQDISPTAYTQHVVPYNKSYDFSLYDLLAVSDMLISDYSSVIHDYIITGKPVVMDFFDYDLYKDSRGFAFEPVEIVCPGKVCKQFDELKAAVVDEFKTSQRDEKYYWIQKMFHKYVDDNSCSRVWTFLKSYIQ